MNRTTPNLFANAPFTFLVLAINAVLFVICAIRTNNVMVFDTQVLAGLGASQREALWQGEWLRLIAPMFLHGGLLHIGMNMTFLWRAGPGSEAYFGTSNFATIYLLSGIAGFCLSQIFGGHLSIGASGSLCGIMGAHLAVLILRAPVPSKAWRNAAVRSEAFQLLFLVGIGLLGFMGMDNWCHVGGMLVGFVLGAGFELWQRRSALGRAAVIATLIVCALLVCAARWTVFNPTYHIFMAASAIEDDHDPITQKAHVDAARSWASTWAPLHPLGVLNVAETDAILHAHDLGFWNTSVALNPRRMMLTICAIYKGGAMNFPMITPTKSQDDADF